MHRLKQERTHRELSQRAIAQLSLIPQPTISQIETGRLKPTRHQLQRLAAVFNLSPEDLLKNVEVSS